MQVTQNQQLQHHKLPNMMGQLGSDPSQQAHYLQHTHNQTQQQ